MPPVPVFPFAFQNNNGIIRAADNLDHHRDLANLVLEAAKGHMYPRLIVMPRPEYPSYLDIVWLYPNETNLPEGTKLEERSVASVRQFSMGFNDYELTLFPSSPNKGVAQQEGARVYGDLIPKLDFRFPSIGIQTPETGFSYQRDKRFSNGPIPEGYSAWMLFSERCYNGTQQEKEQLMQSLISWAKEANKPAEIARIRKCIAYYYDEYSIVMPPADNGPWNWNLKAVFPKVMKWPFSVVLYEEGRKALPDFLTRKYVVNLLEPTKAEK